MYEKLIEIQEKEGRQQKEISPPFAFCPLLVVKKEIEEWSPAFFDEFKKFTESLGAGKTELEISYERRVFFSMVFLGVFALHSANRRAFHNSRHTIERLKKEKREKKDVFFKKAKKDLEKLDPYLYEILFQKIRDFEVEKSFEQSFLFLLEILIEELKETNHIQSKLSQEESRKLIKDVEAFLREERLRNQGGS